MKQKEKYLFSFKKGFTLIEVSITAAIIGLMAVVAFVSLQRGKIDKEVNAVAQQVAASIREAQNYALAGKQISTTTTTCGFGFRRVNATTYNLFYNHTTNVITKCDDVVKIYSTALPNNVSANVYANIVLPNRVSFLNNVATGVITSQRMYFAAPFGNIFNFDGSSLVSVKTLLVRKTPITYAICVSSGGSVEVVKGSVCP